MKSIKLIYALIFLFALNSIELFSEDSKTEKITFLHFNDIYDFLPEDTQGGIAGLLTLLEEQRKKFPDAITVVSGDFLSPSILSVTTKGKHIIELFNKMDIDFVTFGNHEFDMGPAVLLERIKESNFTWINSNVLNANNQPFGNSFRTKMKTVGGINVGFFGITSPESAILSRPGKTLLFNDPIKSARLAVKALKEQGAQVIVAITHLDYVEDRDLIEHVKGINLVLGGHDHIPITWKEGDALIQKSGSQGQYLGVVHLILDKDSDGQLKKVIPEWSMIANYGIPPSPKLKADIDHYRSILDEALNVPLAKVMSELDSRTEMVRTREASMGNLIVDILRENYQADVSFINGGSIRGNRLYRTGRQITEQDILRELPFGNIGVKIKLKGKELKAMLEHGVSKINTRSGRFPQVSGLTLLIDRKAEAGDRLKKVIVNGNPLDMNKTYVVATSEYITEGGDGYQKPPAHAFLINDREGEPISKMVIDHLKQQKVINKQVENRIIYTDEDQIFREQTMANFTLTSPVFENNTPIPMRYSCQGEDVNPPLDITGIPEGTASLVLIIDDPDAPMGTWDHWVVWNIAPTTQIQEDSVPEGAVQGMNSWRRNDYGGPCPPSGTHRYLFKLYALDTKLDMEPSVGKGQVEAAMDGHILGKAQLIGLYMK